MTDALFQPIQVGRFQLANRIVMPPMTRSRASQPNDVANDLMAKYYAQRACMRKAVLFSLSFGMWGVSLTQTTLTVSNQFLLLLLKLKV